MDEVRKCVVLAARTLIEKDPGVQLRHRAPAARLDLRHEVLGEEATQARHGDAYAEYFPRFVKHGIELGLLNEALLQYDLKRWARRSTPDRDLQFGYLGLQTLYDRYFLSQYVGGRRIELPQASSCAWRWASR